MMASWSYQTRCQFPLPKAVEAGVRGTVLLTEEHYQALQPEERPARERLSVLLSAFWPSS
jgi:hypothetical protein